MNMNWFFIGSRLADLLIPTLLSISVIVLLYRKYVAPEILASLEAAVKTTTTISSLAGITKAQREGTAGLTKAVTQDIVKARFPEMELIKLAVSPGTWEQIEDALENNPAGVMDLIEKYGHYFGMEQTSGQSQLTTDF